MRRALILLFLAFPGAAHASGSLVYARGGDVYVAAPDGSRELPVTTDGGYASPSQADDGLILAVRQTAENGRNPRRLHRFAHDGTPLGAPIETTKVDNSFYVGPLAAQVSPDGTTVAYHYFYTGPLSDKLRPVVAYSRLDSGTEPGVFGGTLGNYMTPSWTADGHVIVSFAAQRTAHVGIHAPGGDYADWFGDPAVETLLTNVELTRSGDKLVGVGDRNDLRFYDSASLPNPRCVMTGFSGSVSDPTWSPEGDAVAWEEADGIHVGTCEGARSLVVPGGSDPDWGPAGIGAAGPSAPPATDAAPPVAAPPAPTALRLTLTGWRGTVTARRKLAVGARCSIDCTTTATLTVKRRTIARTSGKGAMTLRLKTVPRRANATLKVTAVAGGQRVTVTRKVRLA